MYCDNLIEIISDYKKGQQCDAHEFLIGLLSYIERSYMKKLKYCHMLTSCIIKFLNIIEKTEKCLMSYLKKQV